MPFKSPLQVARQLLHLVRQWAAAMYGALAKTGGALEINTRLPVDDRIVAWWAQEGGRAVTFGSDAHTPDTVTAGLSEAATVAAALGFEPTAQLADPWHAPRR